MSILVVQYNNQNSPFHPGKNEILILQKPNCQLSSFSLFAFQMFFKKLMDILALDLQSVHYEKRELILDAINQVTSLKQFICRKLICRDTELFQKCQYLDNKNNYLLSRYARSPLVKNPRRLAHNDMCSSTMAIVCQLMPPYI